MYLCCKAIHERTDVRVLLTGEISDGAEGADQAGVQPAGEKEAQGRVRVQPLVDPGDELVADVLAGGLEMFARLDAEFALVLYDGKTDSLIAARDPIGIRPLYYGLGRPRRRAAMAQTRELSRPPERRNPTGTSASGSCPFRRAASTGTAALSGTGISPRWTRSAMTAWTLSAPISRSRGGGCRCGPPPAGHT